jgi:hypothetical protein
MFPPSPAKTHSWIICVCSYAFSHYMYIIYIYYPKTSKMLGLIKSPQNAS